MEYIFFTIGSICVLVVFATYLRWLSLYAKTKNSSVSQLYSKGLVLPFRITEDEKLISKVDRIKLNKVRSLIGVFLVFSFVIGLVFNLIG